MAKKLKPNTQPPVETAPPTDINPAFFESEMFWRVGSFAVAIIAFLLRFLDLPLKPLHHDEGVNGFFLTTLVRSGVYKYDPSNYHGPTLYFFTQFSSYLVGLNDYAVRGVTAIFGLLTVILIFSLRRYLGTIGTLAAGLFIALSPGMVYISRYFIHEMLFVFFTFGAAVGVVKFFERERVSRTAAVTMFVLLMVCLLPGTISFSNALGDVSVETKAVARIGFLIVQAGIVLLLVRALTNWDGGRPIYMLLAAASAVLTFATKETAFISFGTMIIAVVCVLAFWFVVAAFTNKTDDFAPVIGQPVARAFGSPLNAALILLLSVVVFAYVGALFFSSFFTHNEGIIDAFRAYDFWTKTGNKDHTQNGFFAYFYKWGWIEAPIFMLAALGALIAFVKAKHKFAMFCALWGFGLLAAYTLIPYKTPWLAVNFVLPLGLIAGYGINEFAVSRENWQRFAAVFLAVTAFCITAYYSVELNFYKYDDNEKPYIYAHTTREFFGLVEEIKRVADVSGRGKEASIIVVSPEYWSLPWYLREHKGAAFYGSIQPANTAEMVVGSKAQEKELEKEYSRHYVYTGLYPLRPGVELMLYVRKDLAEAASGK